MSVEYLVSMKLRFGRKYKNNFYCGCEDFSKDSVSFKRKIISGGYYIELYETVRKEETKRCGQ